MQISLSEWAKGYLWCFIRMNNPELAVELEDVSTRNAYLDAKVTLLKDYFDDLLARNIADEVIEELAVKPLTADLVPSRYNYILNVLRRQFPSLFKKLQHSGHTKLTALELLKACEPDFQKYVFESEIPRCDRLYYATVLRIMQHLESSGSAPC